VNARIFMQRSSLTRLPSFGLGFLCRALPVGLVVTLMHQFAWGGLRYATSEIVLRPSGSSGLSAERVSADTLLVQGNHFRFDISCTPVDVIMGIVPLAWAFNKSIAGNLVTPIPMAGRLFALNTARLEVGQFLYACGVPWVLADKVFGGIAHFAVWTLLVLRFRKYWRPSFQLRTDYPQSAPET